MSRRATSSAEVQTTDRRRVVDAVLLEELSAGNRTAFDILFDRYFPRVFHFVACRVEAPDQRDGVVRAVLARWLETWLQHPQREPAQDPARVLLAVARQELLALAPRTGSAEAPANASSAPPARAQGAEKTGAAARGR